MVETKNPAEWMQLYHAALLEVDLDILADRITQADDAIQQRLRDLREEPGAAPELRTLLDAVHNLEVLRAELPGYPQFKSSSHVHPELKGNYVAVVNADRKYVAVTDGVCRLLGYSRAELLKMTIDEVTAPELANDVPVKFEKYVQQGFLNGEHLLAGRDGSCIPIRYESRVFADGCMVARWEPLEKSSVTPKAKAG